MKRLCIFNSLGEIEASMQTLTESLAVSEVNHFSPAERLALIWALFTLVYISKCSTFVSYNEKVKAACVDKFYYPSRNERGAHKVYDNTENYYSGRFIEKSQEQPGKFIVDFLADLQTQLILNHQREPNSKDKVFPYKFTPVPIDQKIENLKAYRDDLNKGVKSEERYYDDHISDIITLLAVINKDWIPDNESTFSDRLLYDFALERIYHSDLILNTFLNIVYYGSPFVDNSYVQTVDGHYVRIGRADGLKNSVAEGPIFKFTDAYEDEISHLLDEMVINADSLPFYSCEIKGGPWMEFFAGAGKNLSVEELAKAYVLTMVSTHKDYGEIIGDLSKYICEHEELFRWVRITHCNNTFTPVIKWWKEKRDRSKKTEDRRTKQEDIINAG